MHRFLNNKYSVWYFAICNQARARGPIDDYTERHHILPRSMGGSNLRNNLVDLTFREHFLVHWLLTKFTQGADVHRMNRALLRMGQDHLRSGRRLTSWQYARARRAAREMGFSEEHRANLSRHQRTAPRTEKQTAALRVTIERNRGNASARLLAHLARHHESRKGEGFASEALARQHRDLIDRKRGVPRPPSVRAKISEGNRGAWRRESVRASCRAHLNRLNARRHGWDIQDSAALGQLGFGS